jgi:hypothetical protein
MALRIIVNTSAIKSDLDIYPPILSFLVYFYYQLAFFTPGIKPCQASSLKHIRHNWNLRKYPPDLPQIAQRLCLRLENFAGLFHRAICEFLAMSLFNPYPF